MNDSERQLRDAIRNLYVAQSKLESVQRSVMDLLRPQSISEAKNIVTIYPGDDPEVLRGDFLNSLLAAYRPAEIVEQLASVNMNSLHIEVVSDRHFIAFGSIT